MQLSKDQLRAIEEQRGTQHSTRRATVPPLDEILYEPFPVLDHGFIRVIDYLGSDSAVVQAARVSYGHGTKRLREDGGLIRYLMRNRHTTPFEMCEIKLHVKLPIFVARQWIRHRTANVNEYSARYSILANEFYLPTPDHLGTQSATNRQGRGQPVGASEADLILKLMESDAKSSYEHYRTMINEDEDGKPSVADRSGIARELARTVLPVSFYTEWYWKTDLHNLLHFLQLRLHAHAQYEIRAYAQQIAKIVNLWVPLSFAAFDEYRIGGFEVSRRGRMVIRRMLTGEHVDKASSGLTAAEWTELMNALSDQDP